MTRQKFVSPVFRSPTISEIPTGSFASSTDPPPKYGSARHRQEVDEAMQVNAGLTLEQKTIVEFMREGPRSTGQSGH